MVQTGRYAKNGGAVRRRFLLGEIGVKRTRKSMQYFLTECLYLTKDFSIG